MAKTKRDKTKRRSSADFMIASGNDVPFNYVESFKPLRTNLNYFLYDAVDFCDVFLVNLYILKSPHLVLPYFGVSL